MKNLLLKIGFLIGTTCIPNIHSQDIIYLDQDHTALSKHDLDHMLRILVDAYAAQQHKQQAPPPFFSEAEITILSIISSLCVTSIFYGKDFINYISLDQNTGLYRLLNEQKIKATFFERVIPTLLLSLFGSEIILHIVNKVLSEKKDDSEKQEENLHQIRSLMFRVDHELRRINLEKSVN